MMTTDRFEQKWILDTFLSSAGFEVLHPTGLAAFEQLGYNRVDLDKVFAKVKSARMVPGAWARVAEEVEKRAAYWESRSSRGAALAMYERSMLLFGRAYYSAKENEALRTLLLKKMKHSFSKVAEFSSHKVEHVEIDMDGAKLAGIFEAHEGTKNAPCVILLPGMDMFKEDWHKFIKSSVLPRGWVAFGLDSPGQGESRANGLKLGIDNGPQAISAVIEWLEKRPEVDSGNIFLYGASLGCWWGARAAAKERRVKGLVGAMAIVSGNMDVAAYQAQPSFFRNLKFMTGLSDNGDLGSFIEKMKLTDVLHEIKVPFLSVAGEYDELTTLDESLKAFDKLSCPKEFWIYGDEFHSLGNPSNEWLSATLDWIEAVIKGQIGSGHSRKIFMTQSGDYQEGDGFPAWTQDRA